MESLPMKSPLLPCPSCHSEEVVKNGRSRHGKQSYKCRDCGRQFVKDPQWQPISKEMKGIIDRLLLEKISLAGIARALQISELWVQQYVNHKSKNVPQEVKVRPKPKRRLTVQMDELWSFVDDKGNEQWVWESLSLLYLKGTEKYLGLIRNHLVVANYHFLLQ